MILCTVTLLIDKVLRILLVKLKLSTVLGTCFYVSLHLVMVQVYLVGYISLISLRFVSGFSK